MGIYILLLMIIIIFGVFFAKKQKKFYCIIIGLILLLLAGCRDKSMGIVDTEMIYIPTYNKIKHISFTEIDDVFFKDILFHYTTKAFITIIDNPQLWLAFLALPFVIGVCVLIYKESDNPILSFLLLLSLNFYRYEFYFIETFYSSRNNCNFI